jgi:psp operon transcriptional activator
MQPSDPDRLIGEAPAFLQVLEAVSRVAPLDKPVLIVGERGTGKELIAARLHFLSNRWDAEFLKLNCAAINDTLLESELFGHEAGAFTGATRVHRGRFERADGGTLFLDELATSSPLVQEKILRVIEYGEFERVGGNRTLNVNVRLIAATNEDLPSLAAAGTFRMDLLDRLAFDVITLPPLRARTDDIPLLAERFGINMATELGHSLFPGFTEQAMNELLDHHWPGNVRELKNVVERAVYRNPEPMQPIEDVLLDPFESPFRPGAASPRPAATPVGTPSGAVVELDAASDAPARATPALPVDLKQASEAFEIELLGRALEQARFNQRKAADLLNLTYHQLRGYLRKYDLLKQNSSGRTTVAHPEADDGAAQADGG